METNYYDKQNIFDPIDIEEKTQFKTTIKNFFSKITNVSSRF